MKLDDKNKKKLILGVLIIISALVWGRNLLPVKKKLREISRKGNGLAFNTVKAISRKFKIGAAQDGQKRRASRTQAKDWGRNPFTATTGSESGISGLQLGGIISDASERYALLNDQIAHEGDIIGAYKVVRINEGGVIVNDGNKDIELKLEQ